MLIACLWVGLLSLCQAVPPRGDLELAGAGSIVNMDTLLVSSDPFIIDAAVMAPDQESAAGSPGIAEALSSHFPEIGIIRKAGMSNDIVIRGLSQDNLTVTIDGRKMFGACSNRMDPPISHAALGQAREIVITQGAFDLRRSGSLGGSVNVLTRQPAREGLLEGRLSVGSYGAVEVETYASGGSQRIGISADFGFKRADPYETGSGLRLTDLPDRTSWPLDDYLPQFREVPAYKAAHAGSRLVVDIAGNQKVELNYNYRYDEGVLFPGLRMDADMTRTHQMGMRYTLLEQQPGDISVTLDAYWAENDHDMRDSLRYSSRVNPAGMPRPQYVLDRGWFMESIASSGIAGVNLDITIERWDIDWTAGLEYLERRWDSNNRIGAGMPNSGPGAEIVNSMIPNTLGTTVGGYVQGQLEVAPELYLMAGGRVDLFETEARDSLDLLATQFGGKPDASTRDTGISGAVGLRYLINDSTHVYAGAGSVIRVPNGQERYIQIEKPGDMPNWLGNPDLGPTRNTEFDIGIQTGSETWTLRIKGFYAWLTDYIVPERRTPGDLPGLTKPAQTYAAIDAVLYGVDSRLEWSFANRWRAFGGIAWQRGEKRDQPFHNPHVALPEVPPLTAILGLRYEAPRFFAELRVAAADEQDRIDPSVGEYPVDGYIVPHFQAGWEVSDQLTLLFGVDNLFDEGYGAHNAYLRNPFSTYAHIEEAGRRFTISARISL